MGIEMNLSEDVKKVRDDLVNKYYHFDGRYTVPYPVTPFGDGFEAGYLYAKQEFELGFPSIREMSIEEAKELYPRKK
jgi:hypothetical protein